MEDGLVARIVWFDAGDHDRSQPQSFARVLVGPSDRDIHDGVAGTVEQRHHAEPDVAGRDPGVEVVVHQVGRRRPGRVHGLPALFADRHDLELDEPRLAF